MLVFVPFTRLCALTHKALPHACFVPLIDKEYGYGRYFQERWAQRKTFINVEHDIVPTMEVLESMWECKAPLCISGYHYPEQEGRVDIAYLGCAKISKELIEANPNGFLELKHWTQCDGEIWKMTGETYCQHGSVLHLHVDSHWTPEAIARFGR